jgi:energy-converting hydrogenase Eha subunit B
MNFTIAKKLGKWNECHNGQQTGRFLAINIICHAMPLASHTTMLKSVTTYKLKGDKHH